MPSLPGALVPWLVPFALLFDARTWRKVQRLLIGAGPASLRITLWTGRPPFSRFRPPPTWRNRHRSSPARLGSSAATLAEHNRDHPCDSPV